LRQLYPGIGGLDDSLDGRLFGNAQTVNVPAGELAFRKGDACRNFILVLSGCVRVQLSSAGGREVTLYRVRPGDTCALTTSCLVGKEDYPAEAIVEEDITALMIPDQEFRQALLDSEVFRLFVFRGFSGRLCAIVSRMEAVTLKTIDERLVEQLLKGDSDLLSNITHQVLATEIGTAREVVSRKLRSFEADGLIRSSRGRIEILDREKLTALASRTGS
jgi:CRP/FNR family transcriptional regulator